MCVSACPYCVKRTSVSVDGGEEKSIQKKWCSLTKNFTSVRYLLIETTKSTFCDIIDDSQKMDYFLNTRESATQTERFQYTVPFFVKIF